MRRNPSFYFLLFTLNFVPTVVGIPIVIGTLCTNLFPAGEYVEITAGKVEYINETGRISAKNNVVVKSSAVVVTSDEIIYDTERNLVSARGKVNYFDGVQRITSESANFVLNEQTGVLTAARSVFEQWYSGGKEIEKSGKNEYIIRKGFITTCDLEKPHYRLSSTKMRVYPKDHLEAFNVFLLIGRVPVLYLPYYWQPLRKLRFDFEAQFGYSGYEGAYMKSAVGYQLARYVYAKYYFDYFELKGAGHGARVEIDNKKNFRNSLYAYYIEEKFIKRQRWIVNLSQAHRLPFSLNYSVNYNYQSDENVSDSYRYSTTPGLLSDASGEVWQGQRLAKNTVSNTSVQLVKKHFSAGLTAEKNDTWTQPNNAYKTAGYVTYLMTLPSIRFSTTRLKIKNLPFNYSLSADYSRSFASDITTTTVYQTDSANATVNITDSFGILKNYITLSPQAAFYGSSRQNSDTVRKKLNVLDNRGGNSYVNLRLAPFRAVALSVKHSYSLIFDSTTIIAANSLGYDLRLIPASFLQFYFYTAYDLNMKTKIDLNRYSPFTGEIRLSFGKFNAYTKSDYYFIGDYISNVLGGLRNSWSGGDADLSFGYLSSYPSQVDCTFRLSHKLTKNWNINYAERYAVNRHYPRKTVSVEKELAIKRDLHCWEGRISYKTRANIEEIWITFNIKAFPAQKLGLYHETRSGDWYFRGAE